MKETKKKRREKERGQRRNRTTWEIKRARFSRSKWDLGYLGSTSVSVWWVVGTSKPVRRYISKIQGSYTVLARYPDGVLPHTTSALPLGVVSARCGARSKVEAGIVSDDDELWAVDRFRTPDAFLSLNVASIVAVDASTSFLGFSLDVAEGER